MKNRSWAIAARTVWVMFCLTAATLSCPAPAVAVDMWSTTGNLINVRVSQTATLLANGKVLVAGGFNGVVLTSAELYDAASGTWSPTGSLTTGRGSHTATLLSDGKVLVAGGADSSSVALTSVELYDPVAGTWSDTGTLTTVRYGHTATLLPNGKILVVGGANDNDGYLTSAELYDPIAGTWSATGSLTIERYDHTATLLPDGTVLVAGGSNSTMRLTSAQLYDPTSGTWSTTGSLALARSMHTATLLPNGNVLVAGGYADDPGGDYITARAELYDPAIRTWRPTGSMMTARFDHTATLLPNGKLLAAAGIQHWYLSSAELYDSRAGTWSATASLITERYGHTATLLPNGEILAAAGYNGFGELKSAELYGPAATPTGDPTATPTSTPTQTASNTPTATLTLTPTYTASATPTQTPLPTRTPTLTPSGTPTNTPTQTPTNSPTQTRTETPTPVPTGTPTDTPTSTPTQTAANTATPTDTPCATLTQTPLPTWTPTPQPSDTPKNTPTQTPTNSPTQTRTETPTQMPTATPFLAPTITVTPTPTTPHHDAVVLPVKPLKITVPLGASVTKKLHVKVRNADAGEVARDTIKLTVSSDCPSGITVGLPDFVPSTPGVDDTASLFSGQSATALVPLTVHPFDFASQNHKAPSRCTLTFTASTQVPGNVDPAPSNNTMTAEINVIDKNVAEAVTDDESLIDSLPPLVLTIAATLPSASKNVRPRVTNADILPVAELPGDAIQVTVDLGGCPGISNQLLDMNSKMSGVQDTVLVAGGRSATGLLRLTADAASISTRSALSPMRCSAVVSAAAGGHPGPDRSNNTTKLIIDVVDRHDF